MCWFQTQSPLGKFQTWNFKNFFFPHIEGKQNPLSSPLPPSSQGYCRQQLTQPNVYQSNSEHMTSHYDSWKMSSSLQSTGKFPCRLPTFQCGRGFPGGLVSGEHLLKSSLRAFPHVRLPVQQISSSHRVSLHWSGGAKYAKRRGTDLIHGIGKMGLSQANA